VVGKDYGIGTALCETSAE